MKASLSQRYRPRIPTTHLLATGCSLAHVNSEMRRVPCHLAERGAKGSVIVLLMDTMIGDSSMWLKEVDSLLPLPLRQVQIVQLLMSLRMLLL